MSDVLFPYMNSFVIIFLDDILVYNANQEEHISHLLQEQETLKKYRILSNLMKCNIAYQYSVYFEYVIGGGNLNIDPTNMEFILKWLMHTHVFEIRSFFGVSQYMCKFIASFSIVDTPLHFITTRGKSFSWGENNQKVIEEMKNKISHVLVLTFPNLQKPLKTETDASGYAMGVVLMQGEIYICYHSKIFNGTILNYPTYDKELYALVQVVKKWKLHIMVKETIIHTNHQFLQYLQAQRNQQQTRHHKRIGFLQQFPLCIKYKKNSTNKLVDMLSRPPTSKITALGNLLHMKPLPHNAYQEKYTKYEDKKVFQQLQGQIHVEYDS